MMTMGDGMVNAHPRAIVRAQTEGGEHAGTEATTPSICSRECSKYFKRSMDENKGPNFEK